MNLNQLVSEVYSLTGRPDLSVRTVSAVKRATLTIHQEDFYSRDLFEVPLIFDEPAYLQQIEYATVWPRFRSLQYIRKYDATTGTPGTFFKKLEAREILDRFGDNKTNVWYLAGALIQIRSNTLLEHALASAYLHPDITDAGFSSWVANEHPFAIVYEATREIFKSIGKDEEYARLEKNVAEQKLNVAKTGLSEEGS